MSNDSQANVSFKTDEAGVLSTGKSNQIRLLKPKIRWFDVLFVDDDGHPVPDVEFEIRYANGKKKTAQADKNGYYKEENTPEGRIWIKTTDGAIIESFGSTRTNSKDDIDPKNKKPEAVEVIIRRGDTLSKIARKFGTKWRKLYKFKGPDGMRNSKRLRSGSPHLIYPGEIIWVPTKRRVVRLHTKYSSKGIARVRVRKKRRGTIEQKAAQRHEIYQNRWQHYAIDNLALSAGWDKGKNTPDIDNLCEEITPVFKCIAPTIGKNWNLYLIQDNIMTYYDSEGEFKYKFQLNTVLRGKVGAYTLFQVDNDLYTAGMYDMTTGLNDPTTKSKISIEEIIVGEEGKKVYKDSLYLYNGAREIVGIKKVPVLYLAPANWAQWTAVAYHAGSGILDEYIGDDDYNENAHERNLRVIDTCNAFYRGEINKYIEKVKAIEPKLGENAVRKLGPPPEPYRFPIPLTARKAPIAQKNWDLKLASKMGECSTYFAWLAITNKLWDINLMRWKSTEARHSEGNIFLRIKLTVEPNAGELLDKASDWLLFGHLSTYEKAGYEFTFDAGTDGVTTGHKKTLSVVENGGIKIPGKVDLGLGRTIEIDTSGAGDNKMIYNIDAGGYGVSFTPNGAFAMKGPAGPLPINATSHWDPDKASGGYGITFSIPGVGGVYIGLEHTNIKMGTLLAYTSGAPGFFEKKSCDDLVKTFWNGLTLQETAKLQVLGWNQDLWDFMEFLDFNNDFPSSTKSSLSSLKIEERIAAIHLGFTGEYATNWKKFWLNLSSKEGQKKVKKKNKKIIEQLRAKTKTKIPPPQGIKI